MFILRSSKTHWKDVKPQIIKINSQAYDPVSKMKKKHGGNPKLRCNGKSFCPFQIIKQFVKVRQTRKKDEEQFFIFADRSAVQAQHYRSMLKQTIEAVGLNSKNYECHSTRAGRSLDLLEMGLSVSVIQKLGRWSSNAVYIYLKTDF